MERQRIYDHIEKGRQQTADLLRDLDPSQWEAQSLCEGWKVRDVAAHLSLLARLNAASIAGGLVRARMNFNRWIADEARQHAAKHEPGELIAELRLASQNRYRPPGASAVDPLADLIIHTLDITVPLGIEWSAPTDAAIAVADRLKLTRRVLGGARISQGLRLEATNAPWSHGSGPLVRGPIEHLVLLLAGRRIPLDALEGDGVEVLRQRGV